jgi:signal recognition particle receptor subunit beta
VAIFDQDANVIVISVVYDGPPEAGKTTSVRALARSVGKQVFTPEEQNGRTVFFDWMEYTGGRFEGAPIRCQIASVPGHRRWIRRRARFLDTADVIVFVGDTGEKAWPDTLSRLEDLRARLAARYGPPVGIVFQANKRDRPDAVPLAQLREWALEEGIGLVESTAHEGVGIREAFVLAVRLALERVRELQGTGQLPCGRPEFHRGEDILAQLTALASPAVEDDPVEETDYESAPRPPTPDAPIGWIWPPVEGRLILHEVAALGLRARVSTSGNCVAGLGSGWRIHSRKDALYVDLDEGRAQLVDWAREHAAAVEILSRQRCIALAATGDGRWRIWQLVRAQPSLREAHAEGLAATDPQGAARALATASRLLVGAARMCQAAGLRLECSMDSIGVVGDRPVYVGLMPRGREAGERPDEERVTRDLASLLDGVPRAERPGLRVAIEVARNTEFAFSGGARVADLLVELLAA